MRGFSQTHGTHLPTTPSASWVSSEDIIGNVIPLYKHMDRGRNVAVAGTPDGYC